MDLKSILGYAHFSPFRDNPYLDIQTPEGTISMENTSHDIMGTDNLGNTKLMKAFNKNPYKFEGNIVREIPVKQYGGLSELYKYIYSDDEQDYTPETRQQPAEEEPVQSESFPQEDTSSEDDLALQIAMGNFLPQEIGGIPMSSSNPYLASINPYLLINSTPTPVTAEEHMPVSRTNSARYALDFFQRKGLPKHVAAGIVGNLIQESGNFRQDVIEGRKKGDSGLGFGIAQWHPDRQQGLMNWASARSVSPYSLDSQLEYVYHEAQQRGDLQKTLAAKNAEDAARIFAKTYERPAIIDPHRIRYAKNLYNE